MDPKWKGQEQDWAFEKKKTKQLGSSSVRDDVGTQAEARSLELCGFWEDLAVLSQEATGRFGQENNIIR